MDIVFLILNYNTYIETKECIQSIEDKIDTDNYRIVIVDNSSVDDSVQKIKSFIEGKEKIELIATGENLGFARGNNFGIKYINENYTVKFIVVLNSDTELLQEGLFQKINMEYESSHFALLGPLILTADGRCDNSPHLPPTRERIENELCFFRNQRVIILLGLYRPYCAFRKLWGIIKHKVLRYPALSHRNMDYSKYQRQIVPQGCFLVFSNHAFDYIDGFDGRTFLYYEEPILYLKLMAHSMTTVYTPEIAVFHKEGRATGSPRRRRNLKFINKCFIDSAKVVLEVMDEIGGKYNEKN